MPVDVRHCDTVAAAEEYVQEAEAVLLWRDHRQGVERFAADAPVIVLTDEPDARLGRAAVAQGAQDHLVDDALDSGKLARSLRFARERWRRERRLQDRAVERDRLGRQAAYAVREEASLLVGRARQLVDHVDHRGQPRVGEIVRAGGRLLHLTRVLGDGSSGPVAADDPEPLAVDLGCVVEAEVARARERYAGASIDVEGDLPTASIPADAHLGILVDTLLANAVAHADPGSPSVSISLSVEGDRAVLRVKDDGPDSSGRLGIEATPAESAADRQIGEIDRYLVGQAVERYDADVRVEAGDPDGAEVVVAFPTSMSMSTPPE